VRGALLLIACLAVVPAASAARRVTVVNDGWTADGVPVTLPQTWNAADGADGLDVPKGRCAHDSVSSPSYARKAVVYRHHLPDPTEGRRLFVCFEGVSQVAKITVNGYPVLSHAGAFTEFACDVTSYLFPGGTNEFMMTVDNRITRDIPPAEGDFTLFGGIYRPVRFVETDRVCIDPMTFGGPGVAVDADLSGRVRVTARIYGARLPAATFTGEEPWYASRGMLAAAATAVGFTLANVFCWLMNRWFVFKPGKFKWYVEFGMFFGTSTIATVIALGTMKVLIDVFGMMTSLAVVVEVIVSFFVNFFVRKFFIFKG